MSAELLAKPKDPSVYVCRMAVLTLRLPEAVEHSYGSPEMSKLASEADARLRKALDADARVIEVEPPGDNGIANAATYYFTSTDQEQSDLAEATGGYQVLRLDGILYFRVRVPIKNQPLYRNISDVPTDEYLVAWDGISLAVQWRQDKLSPTGSGGHVVFDVLKDVAAEAGYTAENIACTASCLHEFVHAELVTVADSPPDQLRTIGRTTIGPVCILPFSMQGTDLENLQRIERMVSYSLNYYARGRNREDAIHFLEQRARDDAAEVLYLSYERAARRRWPNPAVLLDLWRLRGSRFRTRKLLAGLWLALALVDSHRRNWAEADEFLAETIADNGLELLADSLEIDRGVKDLDLSIVRSTIERTATHLESRLVVLATFAGAVAALAGAGLTVLLTK
ncbi:hypothetical protein HPO96_19605 [Kribbella sandramycini]|uniref:Uncharacterized protein n=1 Tax=Kribbella sandramycini TaxID=60450 RepID=A0A7Y4L190_9ACTN|nr:hypothetical protein [Kribbella sandramycini]MBB6564755.1 hypothetical protein [Kribbella sandramycini]NOL42457.1 hypothetical protein [Kribbella sandramycini]